jgi:hypothetical protein
MQCRWGSGSCLPPVRPPPLIQRCSLLHQINHVHFLFLSP